MANRMTAFTLLVLVALIFGLQGPACGEERFGPWKYFAPYYFPVDKSCLGHCFGPDDFLPRYETPPPPKPRYDGDCLNPSMPASMPPVPPRRLVRDHSAIRPTAAPGPYRINQTGSSAGTVAKPRLRNITPAKPQGQGYTTRRQATQSMESGAARFPSGGQTR